MQIFNKLYSQNKNSLSYILLKQIFGLYLILATVLTLIQFGFHYDDVKSDFKQELLTLAKTSDQALSTAVGKFNSKVIKAELESVLKSPRVIGIKLFDSEKVEIETFGEVQGAVKGDFREKTIETSQFRMSASGYFSLIWPVVYSDHREDDRIVGYTEIISSNQLVLDRVYYDFILIIGTAILKTAILWIIILIVLRKVLTQPLKILTEDLEHINDDSLADAKLFHGLKVNSQELYVLQAGFGRMLDRLHLSFSALREKEERMTVLAKIDGLTGLPNRNYFNEQTKRLLHSSDRSDKPIGLLFFDLNGFKKINDSYGHEVGDKLLIHMASLLQKAMRKSDLAARIGGDEFVLITDTLENKEDIYPLIKRLKTEFDQPIVIDGNTIYCHPSIGVSFYPEAENEELLLKYADLAMYEAKKQLNSQTTVCFYTDDMAKRYLHKQKIESLISDGIKNNEFTAYFQPIISIKSPNKVFIEALVRWNSQEMGWVSPDEFIPLIENTVLINDITSCVLTESKALTDLLTINKFCLEKIAINVTADQISNTVFTDFVFKWVEDNNYPIEALSFELTERQMVLNGKKCKQEIDRLRNQGIKIALDDFGTGYSSLTHLLNFSVDILKIDRSLIDRIDQNPLNQALLAGMIEMSGRLNIEVVAEGVERKEEYDLLVTMGCDYIQGDYLAKAMSMSDVVKFYGTSDH